MKEKIFFWTTAVLVFVVVAVGIFFAVRKSATPAQDNGIEFTSVTAAQANPSAAFRLDLRYISNGTTTFSADGVASTTGTSTQLGQIPVETFSLTNLTVLNLSGNMITSVPSEIGNLKNLQVLYLGNNQLTGIPDAICALSHLTLLSLFHNEITTLPSCLSGMTSLATLGLSGNPIPTSTIAALRSAMASTTILF